MVADLCLCYQIRLVKQQLHNNYPPECTVHPSKPMLVFGCGRPGDQYQCEMRVVGDIVIKYPARNCSFDVETIHKEQACLALAITIVIVIHIRRYRCMCIIIIQFICIKYKGAGMEHELCFVCIPSEVMKLKITNLFFM